MGELGKKIWGLPKIWIPGSREFFVLHRTTLLNTHFKEGGLFTKTPAHRQILFLYQKYLIKYFKRGQYKCGQPHSLPWGLILYVGDLCNMFSFQMMGFAAFSAQQQELFLTDPHVTSESRLETAGLEPLVTMRRGDRGQWDVPDWVMPCVHRWKHFV